MIARSDTVPLRHILLATAVMAVWGTNFVVIHVGLQQLPPLLFAGLRFALALFPAVLFIKRPNVPWRNLAAYGAFIGVAQFGILYIAMNGRITPALASLVVQTQVFFTMALAAWQSRERPQPFQYAALLITVLGLGIIVAHTDATTTPIGLALVLVAALGWAAGNIIIRSTPGVDMLGYVVWASLFSVPPLLAMSLIIEGWPAIRDGLAHAGPTAWAAVAYQAIANTLFGYAVWGWLLSRYPVATIAPMSLLVPVFGLAASAVWLAEPLQPWKLEATALILAGLFINLTWPRLAARWRPRRAACPQSCTN
jgi:O-acetylserine/cysteine efflux transporter